MNTLPPSLRIANAAAVLDGPYGAVTRQAALSGTSRQMLYRDAPRVVQAVDGSGHRQQLHNLSQDNDRLHAERDHLHQQLQQAVVLDTDQLARFAATAQAEGVSLPVARRLLLPLLKQRTPSVAQLGRWTHAAAQKADALLSVLDAEARPHVEQVAADEIFFGRRPCLMVVEQHSLCWLTGRLADNRDGATWAEEFRRWPNLKQVTRDGGSGLAKGVAVVNQQRHQRGEDAIADQEDHFHTLREGRRALRQIQQRVCRAIDAVAAAQRREQKKARRTGNRQGTASATAYAQRHAVAAVEAGVAVEDATPSTVFNGAKAAGGGGLRDHSETKYRQFRQVIDPLLEQGPEATIQLSARRHGNQIAIEAQVAEVAAPGKNTRLRFALVEERVHYAGSNGIRFHHQVVRAMPGGIQGIALEEKSSRHAVTVNLDELRQKLIGYLDEYNREHPFSDSDRPLEFKNLHVVALVQNDDSGAVLQARQVEVTGEPAAKERQTK